MLARVLQARDRGLTMVFTRTKRTAAKVADELTERGFAAAAVHGDLGQGAREQALRAFRSGKVDVLVATDVAARGIDVEDVTHVINYQCPEEDKTYIHRIGRTGRAGKTGIAVSFIDWDDVPRWKLINESLGLDFADPAETYSTSKHLYDDLDIPEGITGRLPSAQRVTGGPGRRGRRGPRRDRRQAAQGCGGSGHGSGHGRQSAAGGSRNGGSSGSGTSGGSSSNGGGRQRTRGGRSADAAESPTAKAVDAVAGVEVQTEVQTAGPATDGSDAAPARRRRSRRRTRGGSAADAPALRDSY